MEKTNIKTSYTDVPDERINLNLLTRVLDEMHRQDSKFGSQRTHNVLEWGTILHEEVGEVAREITDQYFTFNNSGLPEKTVLHSVHMDNIRTELIQVAAVAIQFVKSIELQQAKSLENGI